MSLLQVLDLQVSRLLVEDHTVEKGTNLLIGIANFVDVAFHKGPLFSEILLVQFEIRMGFESRFTRITLGLLHSLSL